jgi:competence protein ComEC
MEVGLGRGGLVAAYVTIVAAALLAAAWARRRRVARARTRPRRSGRAGRRGIRALAAAAVVLSLAWVVGGGASGAPPVPPAGLRITVLDVGQGDAILLQPAAAPAILVDGGPPGEGLPAMLRAAGVTRLAAVLVTHDQSDHVGGIEEALGEIPVDALLYGAAGRALLEEARAAGARPRRIAAGAELRTGRLRLDVVWPPAVLLDGLDPGEDPNRLALVTVVRWGRFSMLLSADAEAEAAPLDPGPVDVLKVAHHGSEDAGLEGLLERTMPGLAVISVGEGNPYGHPTPATLAELAAHGVRTLRTDRDGTIVIDVRRASVEVRDGA